LEADFLNRCRLHMHENVTCNQDLNKVEFTCKTINEVLTFHFLDFLFADFIWLMILELVCMGLLVLRGELTSLISKVQTSLSTFTLDHFCSFRSKLLSRLGLVCLSPHSYYHTAISSIFTENFSFFSLLMLEVIWITRVEIVIRVVF
jgi:hypothetical protein